jgi:3'-phosphoadenosine 5'-phosphosulfate sulfotransferase (PAPS reductase)/FAD synthetase
MMLPTEESPEISTPLQQAFFWNDEEIPEGSPLVRIEDATEILPPAPPKKWKWDGVVEAYAQKLEALKEDSMIGDVFEQLGDEFINAWAAFLLGSRMTTILDEVLPPETVLAVNSSTGKDSTVTAQAVIDAIHQRVKKGEIWTRKVVVAIADTGSEFPAMAARMQAEADAINRLGEKWGVPLTAELVRPPAKHRLLVELCGNGKPLPPVNKKGKAEGVSSWCMDRVKAGTLNKIAQEMSSKHGDYVSVLGTRSAESTRRADSVARHGEGLPLGLSRIARGSQWGLALTPISFWSNRAVSDFLRAFPSPWRPEGRQELREIYAKGSPTETDENYDPSECVITINNEGSVSNSCSDLSGTRYGCWHCFLSENKSLKNTAKRDPAYLWPRKFHHYLRIKAMEALNRAERLRDMGFTREDSFTKTFTFLERYKMLMLLFRTEIESGFTLLQPEEEAMINTFWKKHGVFCVTTEDARQDARIWKETGRWKTFFEDIEDECHRLCNALSEGIPYGAIHGIKACQENPEEEPAFELVEGSGKRKSRMRELELSHLLAFAGQGYGTPPYPKLLAYVFIEKNETLKDKAVVTALTDTPCLLGLPTNTGLLNGMSGTLWECIGVRLPLPWEKEVAQDRNFVYRIWPKGDHTNSCVKSMRPLEILEWNYQNQVLRHGCRTDDPLKDAWFDTEMISNLNPVDGETLKAIFELTAELTWSSERLTDHFSGRRQKILELMEPHRATLLEDSPQGRLSRQTVRKMVRQELGLEEAAPEMHHYAQGMRLAAQCIRSGILNTSLILKFCYVHHMLAVDPKAGEEELANLVRQIPLKKDGNFSSSQEKKVELSPALV